MVLSVLLSGIPTTQIDPIKYSIKVHTSGDQGAGTDADVYIIMYGSTECDPSKATGKLYLRTPVEGNSKKLFQEAQVDEFEITARDLYPLQLLTVGHSGTGHDSDWKLHMVTIQPLPRHVDRPQQVFMFDAWLRKPPNDITIPPVEPDPVPVVRHRDSCLFQNRAVHLDGWFNVFLYDFRNQLCKSQMKQVEILAKMASLVNNDSAFNTNLNVCEII